MNFVISCLMLFRKSEFANYFYETYVIYLIILQVAVCTGRVYFMCHYIGDVLFGSLLGYVVSTRTYLFLFDIFYYSFI